MANWKTPIDHFLNSQFHITNPRKSFQMHPKSLQNLVQSTTNHRTLSDVKHRLFRQSHQSRYFILNGKPLLDETLLSRIVPLSTLSLRSRLLGGGATDAESCDCCGVPSPGLGNEREEEKREI
ncbi:hypothetical protein LR48_Vigan727s001700 [Vigna angularis]|nr:hypothetical protein LR48_Vigan727s001700 [Vigna angularis]